ncbi:hypothetical protein [Dysgonomonas massiliensis]|uniref:hypothetical protein n=1 Tax=Dysgonomonas massiliensis TaxID=2040292 RepID=UPI000C766B7C|nr:hypothetical protein [Dysgonomonas massiliensis]
MKKIIFDSELKNALDYCRENELYFGEGNPNSKILIIGKEGTEDHLSKKQMATKNLSSWSNIIDNNRQINDILFLEDNALYPWKGQNFWLGKHNKDKGKALHGTAPTWYYYQLLVDQLLNKPLKNETDHIDFHEYCFQSELSQINAKMSHLVPKDEEVSRIQSIKEREKLFSLPFFDQFSIIIIACGHYQRNYKFDIENTFKVKWQGETIHISRGNWFNVHYNTINESHRIVIHTRQFSNGISKELINSIAKKCNEFIRDKQIEL